MVQAGSEDPADLVEPELDDRSGRIAAGPDRVDDERSIVSGEQFDQGHSRGRALDDVGRAGDVLADGSDGEQPDGVVGGEFVPQSEDERAHQSRRISRTTSPSGRWIWTRSGIWPGRLWVAQP